MAVPVSAIPGTEFSDEHTAALERDAVIRTIPGRRPDEPLPSARDGGLERVTDGWRSYLFVVTSVLSWMGELLHPGEFRVQIAYLSWLMTVPFNSFRVIDRVRWRRPRGDMRRAEAGVACAFAPWLLFIPLWDALTTREALVLAYPVIVTWTCAFWWLALDSWWPHRGPRYWIALSIGAACAAGLLAVDGLLICWRLAQTFSDPLGDPALASVGILLGVGLVVAGVRGVRRFVRHVRGQWVEARAETTTP